MRRRLHEVYAHLQRYLLGTESLPEFHNWFVFHRAGAADDMVKCIELRLAEYKRGDWSEPQLRGRLLDLLPVKTLAAGEADSWLANSELTINPAGNILLQIEVEGDAWKALSA